ncbi:MAG: type I methionyl aminopeptidase [Deltaproteobacteria bacterium]|nr:type I methionyl aminopeptidase [Deltaproteobacteria bacterium]
MVYIKSQRELDIMRQAGRLVAQILTELSQLVKPGTKLSDLDKKAEQLSVAVGGSPAFKGYMGYKYSLCTSVNEQVVHGIPSDRALKEGDIVGLDFGLLFNGLYSDSAVTVPVGQISKQATQLLRTTMQALYAAINTATPGKTLKDVGRAIEQVVNPHGYGIVREFVGHGIGTRLHEDPQIPNFEAAAPNLKLKPGMTLAFEPMINVGTADVKILDDRWTAVSVDGSLSAHYEHTIAITEDDAEVFTEWDNLYFNGILDHLES